MYSLSPEQLCHYHNYGFVVINQALSPAELETLNVAAHTVAAQLSPKHQDTFDYDVEHWLDGKRFVELEKSTVQFEKDNHTVRVVEPIHHLHEAFAGLVHDSRLTQPIRQILDQEDLALWTCKLNFRQPNSFAFGWHQDSPYWIHNCAHVEKLPNVMVALQPQSKQNGCFQVIPGSHQQGLLPGTNDGTSLGGFYTDPTTFDESHAKLLEVDAGSLIFFHPHIIHGSKANNSTESRTALIYTFQPGNNPTLKHGDTHNVTMS